MKSNVCQIKNSFGLIVVCVEIYEFTCAENFITSSFPETNNKTFNKKTRRDNNETTIRS